VKAGQDEAGCRLPTRGGPGSRVPETTPAGFCVFLSEPESKMCEKPSPEPESLFNFGNRSSLCCHFLRKKTWLIKLGSMTVAHSLNKNRILKFDKLPEQDWIEKFWTRAERSLN